MADAREVVDFEILAEILAVFERQELVDLAVARLLEETEIFADFLRVRRPRVYQLEGVLLLAFGLLVFLLFVFVQNDLKILVFFEEVAGLEFVAVLGHNQTLARDAPHHFGHSVDFLQILLLVGSLDQGGQVVRVDEGVFL